MVPWKDTIKGYEIRKGEFLVVEPDELKAIMPESDRKIRIDRFVYYLYLDPVYFESSYILVPDRSEEAYGLLLTTMQELGRAAAGTITLRTKEYPVVVHVYDGALVLTTLRHADEVTKPHTFSLMPPLPVPKEKEVALAKRIITDLTGDFSINDYPDRYHEAILALIDKKLAGEKIVYEEPHPEEAKELMQALQETIGSGGSGETAQASQANRQVHGAGESVAAPVHGAVESGEPPVHSQRFRLPERRKREGPEREGKLESRQQPDQQRQPPAVGR